MDYTKFSAKLYWQILSQFSRIHIHVDGLKALFVCVKRLGMAFKFGFKFPVGGSAPDIQPIHLFTNSDAILNHDALWVIQGKNPNSKAFNVVLRHNTIIFFL